MNEQTPPAASGAAPAAPETAAPTPSAPDFKSMSDDQVWDALEAPKAEAPEPATPESDDIDAVLAPEGEEPPVQPPPEEKAEEPEKTEEPEKPEEPIEEWGKGTPLEKLTPEQKTFLKANPQLKDAVYRDREYHKLGFNLKVAEAAFEKGLVTIEDIEQAHNSIAAINAMNADFTSRSPEGIDRFVSTLYEMDPESGDVVLDRILSPEFLLANAPEKFYQIREQLTDDLISNAKEQVKTLLENDADAVAAVDAFQSLLADLSQRATKQAPKAGLPPAEKREYERLKAEAAKSLQESEQRLRNDTNTQVATGIYEKVNEEIKRRAPVGFNAAVRNDVAMKISTAVINTLRSQETVRDRYNAILRDKSVSPEQRRANAASYMADRSRLVLGAVAARILKDYTTQAVATNQKRLEQQRGLAKYREPGSGPAAPPATVKITRDMSDAQVWEALEKNAAARARR